MRSCAALFLAVLLMPGLAYVGSAPAAPTVLYALFNGKGTGHYSIGAMTFSGGAWGEYGSNPLLSATGVGFESTDVFQPSLVWDGSQYVMYYVGYNGTLRKIGRATATSVNGPWTRYASNPVLSVGSAGSADETSAFQPNVMYEPTDTGHEWKMWYTGISAGGVYTVCYAESSDGLSWTKYGTIIALGAGAAWDSVSTVSGASIKIGSTYYHLYSGRKNVSAPYHWAGGIASATNPRSTWTKGGSNPTLQAAYVTSGMSEALTSNTTAGSAVVHVGDTSHWVVGMPMLIAAGNVVTEQHNIASIDSGTQGRYRSGRRAAATRSTSTSSRVSMT